MKMSFFRRLSEKKGKDQASKSNTLPRQKTSSASKHGMVTSKTMDSIKDKGSLQLDTQMVKPKDKGLLIPHDDHHPGDLGISAGAEDALMKRNSRLSKSLQELLKDHEAIPYLVQYLESCKASALMKFWSDADSFQASTWTRIRSHSMNYVSKSSLVTVGMTKSKSYNHDITSPLSSGTGSQETKSEDLDTSIDSCDLNAEQDTSNNTDSKSSHNAEISPSHNTANTPDNKLLAGDGMEQSAISDSEQSVILESEQSAILDSDNRTREKCKPHNDLDKSKLSLPLNNCDSPDGSALSGSLTDSAISYRDITTSGPGTPDSEKGSSKPALSPGLDAIPKESLADKLKKSVEQDAVRIFTKYLAQEAPQPIGITDDLRNDTIRKICREDGQVDPECFLECQQFAVDKIEKLYFKGFKGSVYHCKYQVDVLTGGNIKLQDVIYNDTALFYFMEFADQEGFSHLLHFVIATDNFQELLSSQEAYDGPQAQGDAMVLYDKYFSLQAQIPLGFPDDIRFEVEGNICREEGPLPECFAKPRYIVLYTVEKLHFSRFLTSDVYYKYLSEMVSTVQQAQEFPLGQRKRRGSETSSEHSAGNQSVGSESISSKNTLLATGYTHPVQLHKLEENMQHMALDSILLNPDALWERSSSGTMSVGRIDPLGQFVSHFVPDPEIVAADKKKGDKKQGSKFFRSRKDKEKEQEELARKVAEKILQDVTSVTQAISAIKNPAISNANGSS